METTRHLMTQLQLFGVLLAAMTIAGVLGGVINFYLNRRANGKDSGLPKSIIFGIGASFLVPLFLNTISSNLVLEIQSKADITRNMLVFFGFCLVAAISSKAFIESISKRVLDEAREAKEAAKAASQKASEVQSALDPIIEKETEAAPEAVAPGIVAAIPNLGDQEWVVLSALANGDKALRTRTGLAKQTNIVKSEVDRIMDSLRERNLAARREMKKADGTRIYRWCITTEGRDIVVGHSTAAVDPKSPAKPTTIGDKVF